MSAQWVVLCSIYIAITSLQANKLNKGSLPFECGDGSSFGGSYNCNLPPSYPKDRRENENTLRIMQFNADSLFLEGCDGWNSFEPRTPAAKTSVGAMSHLQTIANTIYRMNADIIFIDEVCDCCVLRQLIQHMNRNHISQTYQEYLLQTPNANGEHIGIITRIDPIDIWNVNSVPKQFKPTKYTMNELENEKITESELPPPPIPISQSSQQRRRRLLMAMMDGRAINKKIRPKTEAYTPIKEKPKEQNVNGLQPPPKPVENEDDNKQRTRITEKEHVSNPLGNFRHIAASFNLHLDKPLLIIGAQFDDFAENNEKMRRSQAKDLAKFVNLYERDYHIVVVGDFNSVPEGRVLRVFSDDTGFDNIGYGYFDKEDFTYLSELSMGMLDNMFVDHAMSQKVQDAKIDYTHPKPVWPESNHLPLVIDFDTTWYGGWGAPIHKRPPFRSIKAGRNGEQDAMVDDSGDEAMAKPPPPVPLMPKANVAMEDNEYEYADDIVIDYARYKPEKVDVFVKYEVIDESATVASKLQENLVQRVFKYAIFTIIGSVCLCAGAIIGWLFVGYYRSYKGRVVHVSRF